MTVKDCVKTMLSKRGWSQRKLAEELGYSGQGSIGKTLLRNDGMGMTVETLIKWADAMEFCINPDSLRSCVDPLMPVR